MKKIYIQTYFGNKLISETPIDQFQNYKEYKKTGKDVLVAGFIGNESLKVVFK